MDEASRLVNDWGDSLPSPTNTEARRDEIKRVDTWLGRVNADYLRPPEDPRHMPTSQAVTAFIKLSERRCKLLGLDAPSRAEIEATLHAATPGAIEDEIARLADELGLSGQAPPRQ